MTQPVQYVQPQFRIKNNDINAAGAPLLRRITRLTIPTTIYHPDNPSVPVQDDELTAPVVRFSSGGFFGVTYLLPKYFPRLEKHQLNADYFRLRQHDKHVLSAPQDSTSGVAHFLASVLGIFPSLAEVFLKDLIKVGQIPTAFDTTYITVDFTISLRGALDLGATVYQWPNLDQLAAVDVLGVNDDGKAMAQGVRQPINTTKRIPFQTPAQADAINEAFELNQALVHGLRSRFADNKELATMMLPLGAVVEATATRSITGWRNWLLALSPTYEIFYLKAHFYRHLSKLAAPLVHGCDRALSAFEDYKAAMSLEKGDT